MESDGFEEKITGCIHCSSLNVQKYRQYKIKNSNYKRIQMTCLDCGRYFTLRNANFGRKIDMKIIKKIIKLYKTKKRYINKYDPTKKRTYSTREIAKMLKISKTYVAKIVKNPEESQKALYSNDTKD